MTLLLDAALGYARRGLPVLPLYGISGGQCACGRADCAAPGKHPRTPHGVREATTDEGTIRAWWTEHPENNIGIATGRASGVVVLDADGQEGMESLLTLWAPTSTWWASTGHGSHFFFHYPSDGHRIGNRVGLLPRLDVRGDGGYVVAPPSRHTSGTVYRWRIPPDRVALAALPEAVQGFLAQRSPSPDGHGVRVPERIVQGERNVHLYRLARSLHLRGLIADEILAVLEQVNAQRCDPPLSEAEVAEIARKAASQADRADFKTGGVKGTRHARLLCLAEVEPQPVRWLWDRRIPRGKLTLIIGDPEVGKSYLSLDLGARLSTSRPWPDGTPAPCGSVVLLSAEDAPDDTIRPRLDKLGGDPRRVYVLQATIEGSRERVFNLTADMDVLEDVIVETKALAVVIDPLSAYLGRVDSWRDAEVRSLLAPLANLAERTGVAVIGILHVTKDTERRAIYRALGSVAFTAAPRAVFAVARDPEDDARRFLATVKFNLGPKPPTLAFRISEDGIEWEPTPVLGVDADSALARSGSPGERAERQDAEEFLKELLPGGVMLKVKDILRAADQAGISKPTLYRAKRRLGVKSTHSGVVGESGWEWYWFRPEPVEAQDASLGAHVDAHTRETDHLRASEPEKSKNGADFSVDDQISSDEHLCENLRRPGAGSEGDDDEVLRQWALTRASKRKGSPEEPSQPGQDPAVAPRRFGPPRTAT